MSGEHDPPVHVIAADGKLRVCLSDLAKWLAGILATLIAAILAGAFVFAWQSNVALGQIMVKLEAMDGTQDEMKQRLDRYYDRLEKIERQLHGKVDK